MEQSVVLIKPDGVQRGLIGEIIARLEKAGLKIVALKMVAIDKKMAFKHYGVTEEWFENVGKKVKEFYQQQGYDPGEDFFTRPNKEIGRMVQKWNVDYLTEGPVVAMLIEAPGVIEIVRKISARPIRKRPSREPFAAITALIRRCYPIPRAVRFII